MLALLKSVQRSWFWVNAHAHAHTKCWILEPNISAREKYLAEIQLANKKHGLQTTRPSIPKQIIRGIWLRRNSLRTGKHTHTKTSENTSRSSKTCVILWINTSIIEISCKEMNIGIHGQSITKPRKFCSTPSFFLHAQIFSLQLPSDTSKLKNLVIPLYCWKSLNSFLCFGDAS